MSLIGDGLELLGLLDRARNAELYKQLGDWIEKVRVLQLENDRLLTEQRALNEKIKFTGEFRRVNGHSYRVGDREEICLRCAEVDCHPVHLIRATGKSGIYIAACPQCELELTHRTPMKFDDAVIGQVSQA